MLSLIDAESSDLSESIEGSAYLTRASNLKSEICLSEKIRQVYMTMIYTAMISNKSRYPWF